MFPGRNGALWAVNFAAAEEHGMGSDHFANVLSSFPGFARKRPTFFSYLRARRAEWAGMSSAGVIAASGFSRASEEKGLAMTAEPQVDYGKASAFGVSGLSRDEDP
jgi:hypothetical protein